MGLVPSRESLYETPEAASQPRALPFISRAAENYMYKTNRTERVFGSGAASGSLGGEPIPAALLNGVPTAELALKILEADSNAVFIDDPAEATAAVAASRGSRRGSAKGAESQSRGRGSGTSAFETAAGEALRQGKTPYVYYYEHRVLPLTTEFFPSPDCVLFRQLWHARQHQNPRYHFQLDHTWSPGALTDPTVAYESFTELAMHNMMDIQAACLSAGQPVTEENLERARAQLQAALSSLSDSDIGIGCRSAASTASQRTRVPFATRDEFYNLVVRTTEESRIYDTNEELRAAVCGAATSDGAVCAHASIADRELTAQESSRAERERHRLRPVPCAIVLVRRCMPAHEYRYTYFVANNERHHKTGASAAGGSSRRRGLASTCGTGEVHQQQREPHSTLACGDSVRTAVKESDLVDRTRQSEFGDKELMVPWVQVSVPQAPLGLAELRVVGMYGCWTVEEILRHSLFTPTVCVTADCDEVAGAVVTQSLLAREAQVEKALRRAAPHGVPSSTLVNTAFFEKQVGDKEQCHTYFALCRLFAHGMRQCILGDTPNKVEVTSTAGHAASERASAEEELSDEPSQQTDGAAAARQRADPGWEAFMDFLSGGASAMSTRGDLANCFLIRFSNIPQLQLCRQIRRMLMELQDMYPAAPTLEVFQAAQRQRNMAAMSKKTDASDGAGVGGVQGGNQSAHQGSPLEDRSSGEGTTAPWSLQEASRTSLTDNTGAQPSAAMETDDELQLEAATVVKRNHKPVALPLSLDPEALAERPHQLCERDRLERDGFCCYTSYGLVVFRLSRVAVARALNQLSFAPLRDSVEALCVTLTAAAPPPLTYRGELRPPAGLRTQMVEVAERDVCSSSKTAVGSDGEERGSACLSAVAYSPEALANTYHNAMRYSSSSTTGFSMEPVWPMKMDNVSWATHATALEDTPDELIGVLPRNAIEQRRGRLLPFCGVVKAESEAVTTNGARNPSAVHQGCSSGPSALLQPHPKRPNPPSSSLLPTSVLLQRDVYTVSAELNGTPFREVMELVHQEQQQLRQSAYDDSQERTPRFIIEAVDSQGNVEPDSVLNWSPMAALGSLRWKRALTAAGCGNAGASEGCICAAAETAAMQSVPPISLHTPRPQRVVSIFVREPERILRTGDRIRFTPHHCGSLTSGERNSPRDAPDSGTPHGRSRGGGDMTSGASRYGYWYVDDRLTTEDMILSWMRRVGGRARETCGTDTKWVRFPEAVLQVLLRFAHACRQQSGGGWLTTGYALHPLHSADEELVEPDLLQNYPDILRTRRFRQWRFSHDGYVYFHGVTVRIPGSAPLPSHPPPAAVMATSAYRAGTHSRGEMTSVTSGGPRLGLAVVPSVGVVFDPPPPPQQQQQPTMQHCSPVTQYGYKPLLSAIMPQGSNGGGSGGQYSADTALGGPVYHPNQIIYPIMSGSTNGSGSVPKAHYSPSMAPQQYPPQQLPPKEQYVSDASIHHTTQQQQTMPQPPPQQDRGPGYGLYCDGAGSDPHYAPTGRSSMVCCSAQEAMANRHYGASSSSAAEGAGRAGPVTPNTVNSHCFKDATFFQRNAAATRSGSNHQPEYYPRGDRDYRADGVGFSEGIPSVEAGFFVDHPSSTFFQSSDTAHSAATVMGQAHVTSSFYEDIYDPSAPQLPHTPQQQQQQHEQYRFQTASPSSLSEPASGRASGSWSTDKVLLSYGSPPNVAGGMPSGQEALSPSTAAAGCGRSQMETARSPSVPSMMHVISVDQPHEYHPQQQPLTLMHPSPSVPAPPPPPQQQPMSYSFHGERDRLSYAAERRTTADYPPRRSSTTILATTAMIASAVKPTLRRLSVHTLRGTHSTGGHRALPVASFAPDVVDPSPVNSGGGGNTRPAIMPKDRTTASVDSGAEIPSDCSESTWPVRARTAPVYHPDVSFNTPQTCHNTQRVYRNLHPHQQPQPAQAPPPRSPHLSSGPGSLRETVTAEVIEANSITVRVMQRKPLMARQSSYNGVAGGAAACCYRTDWVALGNTANVPGCDGGAPGVCSPSPMGYGATGVSPSGGLEDMRGEANFIHRKTGGVLTNDGRTALEQRPYGMPQIPTPTTGQQVTPGCNTAGASAAPQPQRQSSGIGSLPPQRGSQRVSHNPYSNARSLSATPLPAAAVSSAHSQSGASGGRLGSSGLHDSLTDALDNRYGSVGDFNASASASPASLAHNANGMTHDPYYSRGAGDPAGFRGSPATSQRQSRYLSQHTTGDVVDFSCTDQLQEGQYESYASFYETAVDVQTSPHYSDFYQNAAADGTTQGFFFSMGDYGDSGDPAEQLYGGSPNYHYQGTLQGHPLQPPAQPDKGAGRGGSAYGSSHAPTRSIHHHQPPQRNMSGGSAYHGGVYEDGTPASALPYSPPFQ
ncbi:hypothetical protein MNV84_06262 [Leishmania braziliensis]|nr:hypothetical protein MNV84_06262 [Leishmania braziliensis]